MRRLTTLILAYFFSLSVLSAQQEKHFKNIKQLTFGGDNAEAYFSFNGKMLSFQSNYAEWGVKCDQIFLMNLRNKQ
jgi:TolB protein